MSNVCLIALPVELLHRIFDFLDTQTILRSIRGVCRRFYAVVDSYDRYELNFRSTTKSDILHPDKIRSLILYMKNPYQTQYEGLLRHSSTGGFARLHSLVIHEMNTDNSICTLQHFLGSPLISLSIYMSYRTSDWAIERMISLIVQFNLKKICLYPLDFKFRHIAWLSQCPLQHLTVETCSYKAYREILRCFIHLRSFVIKDWTTSDTINQSIDQVNSQLISLSIADCRQSSSTLENLLSLTPTLIHLKLVSFQPEFHRMFHHSRWEPFVQTRLPLLKKIEFYFFFDLKNSKDETTDGIKLLLGAFQSPFWLDYQRCSINYVWALSKLDFRFYSTPICIDDVDKESVRCEVSTRDNRCRLILPLAIKIVLIDLKELITECNEYIDIKLNPIELLMNALREKNIQAPTLDLSLSRIRHNEARQMAEALQEQKTLTTLNLSFNQIGDNGVHYLALALQEHQALTTLNLSSNQIGADGAQYLANALRKNRILTTLRLCHNRIGNDGAQHLAEVLRKKKTISVLTLNDNQIGDTGVQHLAHALRSNKTLIKLHLSCNRIGDGGAQHLADALAQNETLAELDLSNTKIGDDGVQHLADALAQSETLAELDLSNTEIGDDGARYLANGLQKNRSLTTLMLCTERMTRTGAQYIVNASRRNPVSSLNTVKFSRKSVGRASIDRWERKFGKLRFC